eukprot:1160093-Pelagomonas_calceolata.AAC.4
MGEYYVDMPPTWPPPLQLKTVGFKAVHHILCIPLVAACAEQLPQRAAGVDRDLAHRGGGGGGAV